MSNTSILDQRLAYRPAVVELFRRTTEPEIQRAAADIAQWQEQVNVLQQKIANAKTYIAELRQANRDIEASADLPPVSPPKDVECRTCGEAIVHVGDNRWVHADRALSDKGERCFPKDRQSPEAAPVGQNTAESLIQRIETAHDGPNGSKGMLS